MPKPIRITGIGRVIPAALPAPFPFLLGQRPHGAKSISPGGPKIAKAQNADEKIGVHDQRHHERGDALMRAQKIVRKEVTEQQNQKNERNPDFGVPWPPEPVANSRPF